MAYTVKLIALKCLQAQEEDGDEIYVRFNGRTIWSAGRWKMHTHPNSIDMVSTFDFAVGKKLTQNGWELITPNNPDDYVFTGQTGDSAFQLWEADTLTRDDFLGETPVSIRDAGHGKISTAFRREGAHYLLTYEVIAES